MNFSFILAEEVAREQQISLGDRAVCLLLSTAPASAEKTAPKNAFLGLQTDEGKGKGDSWWTYGPSSGKMFNFALIYLFVKQG